MAIINDPTAYFQTEIYTGNGSDGRTITLSANTDMQPDFVWIKNRGQTDNHALFDAVRGANKYLQSSGNIAEIDQPSSGYVSGFVSDGFTVTSGSFADDNVNKNTETYVSWNWKAGGTASSNTDGSITSSVSANQDAGFSIVSWSGTGSNGTIGHGLGSAPQVVLLKERNGTNNWLMSHQPLSASLGDYTRFITLNSTGAVSGAGNVVFQNSAFTSSVFNVGTSVGSNRSGGTYIAYCFAEKQGYSKFGSYTGNGSTDGTFVYTGFKPAFVIFKNTTNTNNWSIRDNKRDSFNAGDSNLFANLSDAESSSNDIDFLSNGFKLRNAGGNWNTSGNTYIYMAFAEEPLVGDNPATAR